MSILISTYSIQKQLWSEPRFLRRISGILSLRGVPKAPEAIPEDVIVSIPEECATIHSGIASIMAKVLIEAIPLGIVTSLRSSQ